MEEELDKTPVDGGKKETQNTKKEETPQDTHAQRMEAAGNMFSGIGDMAEGFGSAAEKLKSTVSLSEATASTSLGTEALKTMGNTNLATIIASPLNAAIDAQYTAAKKTLQCINEIGVKNGALAVVTFTFFKNGRKAKLAIPLLTLVPINNMRINEMTYNFKLAIKTSSQLNMVSGASAGINAYAGANASDALAAMNASKSQDQAADAPKGEQKGDAKEADAKGSDKAAEKKADAKSAEKKAPAADADAVKKAVKIEPTFGVSFSSKKDSKATQDSKYSVETSMDVTIKVGPEDMPGGISKMLEILNDSIEVFNPNGELTVSAQQVKLTDGVAVVSAVYTDTEGSLAPDKIKCVHSKDEKIAVEATNNGSGCQFIFTEPGLYMISAEKLKYAVNVLKED